MTHLINKEEIEENGQIYVVENYSNGAVVKYTKPVAEPIEPKLSDTEQAILETVINTEYLVCLADLGL